MDDDVMLSLVSNPFDPFTEYDLWLQHDHHEGFDTAGLLARTVEHFVGLWPGEFEFFVNAACDSIVQNPSFGGMYEKRVRK